MRGEVRTAVTVCSIKAVVVHVSVAPASVVVAKMKLVVVACGSVAVAYRLIVSRCTVEVVTVWYTVTNTVRSTIAAGRNAVEVTTGPERKEVLVMIIGSTSEVSQLAVGSITCMFGV